MGGGAVVDIHGVAEGDNVGEGDEGHQPRHPRLLRRRGARCHPRASSASVQVAHRWRIRSLLPHPPPVSSDGSTRPEGRRPLLRGLLGRRLLGGRGRRVKTTNQSKKEGGRREPPLANTCKTEYINNYNTNKKRISVFYFILSVFLKKR